MKLSALAPTCVVTLALSISSGACSRAPESGPLPTAQRLVATYRTEPTTLNRYVSPRAAEDLIARLTQAPLVRLNRVTGELEPWLATGWTSASADGRVWTLALRQGVTFSDGAPFSAADVQFTFRVLFDPNVKSEMASSLLVGGKPIDVRALDDHTVVLTFTEPYGPGLSLLDAIPILPRHTLEAAYQAGTFREAWGLSTPPSELAGLGPFVLREYVHGQHLKFERNPRYWRRDENGGPLPRLDEIDLQIVPDQNAELLRLEAGTADLTTGPVRPEDLAGLRKLEAAGIVRLADAGVTISPDGLWFNLVPGAAPAKDRPWLQREELRQAISYAVNRRAFADTVYLGAAEPIFGPVTSGNRQWFLPDLPRTDFDLPRARGLLASVGLKDRNGDGKLQDASGRPAEFSILTQKGVTTLERSAEFLAEQLARVGLTVHVVALEQRAMLERFGSATYDAMFFFITPDSFDPARSPDFWMSSGDFHLWQPGQQTPARPWEATIDDLMRRMSTTVPFAERQPLFADIQRTFAAHVPIIYFVAPRVIVATSARLRGATPSVLTPPVLWNAEVLSIGPSGGAGRK